jgi:hypothetical protein
MLFMLTKDIKQNLVKQNQLIYYRSALFLAKALEPKQLSCNACSKTLFPRFENLQIKAALKPKYYSNHC